MGKSVHYQGRCYVFGGETLKGKDAAAGISDQGVFDRVDIYDIAKDSWSQGAVRTLGTLCLSPATCYGLAQTLFVCSPAWHWRTCCHLRGLSFRAVEAGWMPLCGDLVGALAMQDMPAGRHGVFPVQQGCQLHLAGGGWKAANSQSGEYHIYTI